MPISVCLVKKALRKSRRSLAVSWLRTVSQVAPVRSLVNHGWQLTHNRWTAICRGAVIHAANIQKLPTFLVNIEARVARASYGVMLNEPWRKKAYKAEDKYYDEKWQEWLAENQMQWFLKIVRLVKKFPEK